MATQEKLRKARKSQEKIRKSRKSKDKLRKTKKSKEEPRKATKTKEKQRKARTRKSRKATRNKEKHRKAKGRQANHRCLLVFCWFFIWLLLTFYWFPIGCHWLSTSCYCFFVGFVTFLQENRTTKRQQPNGHEENIAPDPCAQEFRYPDMRQGHARENIFF